MNKLATYCILVTLYFASLSHGFVSPTLPKNNYHDTSTKLMFKRVEEKTSPRVNPTYKVTKLQFHDGLEGDKTSKRKTMAANIRGKALDLLLRSYEIDQLEYGL